MAYCHRAKTSRNKHITNGSHSSRVMGMYHARREPKLCVYTMPAMSSRLWVYYARHASCAVGLYHDRCVTYAVGLYHTRRHMADDVDIYHVQKQLYLWLYTTPAVWPMLWVYTISDLWPMLGIYHMYHVTYAGYISCHVTYAVIVWYVRHVPACFLCNYSHFCSLSGLGRFLAINESINK